LANAFVHWQSFFNSCNIESDKLTLANLGIVTLTENTIVTIDIIFCKLINDIYCLPCFAMLLPLVAAAKIHFEEQELLTDTEQSSQANKAGRPTSQAGQKGSLACHFVMRLHVCFVLATSACSS
jgi:hypothetical protein